MTGGGVKEVNGVNSTGCDALDNSSASEMVSPAALRTTETSARGSTSHTKRDSSAAERRHWPHHARQQPGVGGGRPEC